MQGQNMVRKKKINTFAILIWFSIGAIFSLIIAQIHISETGNLNRFYDVGQTYNFPEGNYKMSWSAWSYDPQNGKCTISTDDAALYLRVDGKMRPWNYLLVEINDLSKETLPIQVECLNSKDEIVQTVFSELHNGKNEILMNGVAFAKMHIRAVNENGNSLSIKDIVLKEKNPETGIDRWVKWGGFAFAIYTVFSIVILKLLKKKADRIKPYRVVNGIQKVYASAAQPFVQRMSSIPDQIREGVWFCCFLLGILYSIIIINTGLYEKPWRYNQLFYMILVIIIAIFAIEGEQYPVAWNNRLVAGWMVLWVIACVSDFAVSKVFAFTGYAQLTVWGFCFFIWNNMKQPQKLLRAFSKVVRLSFLIGAAFCLLCRPEVETGRYLGIFYNPNPFANYLIVVSAVQLTQILDNIQSKKRNWKQFWLYIDFLMMCSFLWKTQTRGALIALLVQVIVAMFYIVKKNGYFAWLKWGVCMMILVVPVYMGVTYGLATIPEKVGKPITLERDVYQPEDNALGSLFQIEAYAAESENALEQSRIVRSLKSGSLETISSGRTIYWEEYLRNMNLWGHEGKLVINGVRHDAHNALLTIMYRYGILALIPYAVMWIYSLIYAGRYASRHRGDYAFLPMAICIGFMITALIDAEEQPYISIVWFSMYFIVGLLFGKKEEHCQSSVVDVE